MKYLLGEKEWERVIEWARLGVSVAIRKWDSFRCSHFQEVKGAVSSSLRLKLVMWAQLPRHSFGLHSICAAQLARLLEEPAVEGQPARLEIKHTCSSLLPSGTFLLKGIISFSIILGSVMGIHHAGLKKSQNPQRKVGRTLFQAKRELYVPIYICLVPTIITETSIILKRLSGEK